MKLEFNEHELYLLNKAISKMKYEDAAPLVSSINRQIQDHQSKPTEDHVSSNDEK